MSDAGDVTQLTVYKYDGNVFRNEEGRELSDCPPVLADLYEYWQSRRRGDGLPARGDIDPVDIPALLEHLILVDVLRDPLNGVLARPDEVRRPVAPRKGPAGRPSGGRHPRNVRVIPPSRDFH